MTTPSTDTAAAGMILPLEICDDLASRFDDIYTPAALAALDVLVASRPLQELLSTTFVHPPPWAQMAFML